jgi:hypothetical protein
MFRMLDGAILYTDVHSAVAGRSARGGRSWR